VQIIAISGMHMSIIGFFLFSAFSGLLRRSEWLILHLDTKKAAALACLPPLCFYTLLAGSNTPVMRSLLMSMAVLLALCVNRQKSIFATLALAMFCLLVWSPSSLFTVSFQLTFAAVASIAAIFPFLIRLLPLSEENGRQSFSVRLQNWLIAALAVSVAATVGTAPLLLFSFNRISLVGPLANLVVEPLICLWSLSLGFLACPMVFLFPSLASLLLRAGAIGLGASIKSVGFFYGLPFASLWLPTPSPILIAVYYGALLLLIGGRWGKGVRWTAWPVFLITLVCFWMPPSELLKHYTKDSTITFIDVGQGSASLLEIPTGKRALIDCGGQASPGFNTGEQVVGPFLWKKGFTGINAVIITHPDADHYNGLPFILKHFRPDTLWINGSAGHDQGYTELLALAKALKISIRTPVGAEILLKSEGAEVSVIENPLVMMGHESNESVNDRGMIVKFTDGTFSTVFPGDISRRVEALLVSDRPERLKAQILLSPHHGSSTSNSRAFLQAVHPEFLIVSAGIARKGVFPSRDLAEKAAIYGTKMLTTAMSGCIMVTTDGRGLSVTSGNGIVLDKHISRTQ
jgi:competence protein ComEC